MIRVNGVHLRERECMSDGVISDVLNFLNSNNISLFSGFVSAYSGAA